MRIVLLSDLETPGGAAVAASRLAEALIDDGHEVIRIVGSPSDDGQDRRWETRPLHTFPGESRFRKNIMRLPTRLRVRAERFINRRAREKLDDMLAEIGPTAINVHNLHAARWGPDLVTACTRHAPTVWTLHDMWSFTGRCAYSYDCEKFIDGCDASCPTPREYPALEPEYIADAWESRRRIFNSSEDLAAVTPSRWLARKAQEGLWRDHLVETIPNGVPLETFCPKNRMEARKALDVNPDVPVVLLPPAVAIQKRKGSRIIHEILDKIETRPLSLLTFGRARPPEPPAGVELHALGYVDERIQAEAYSAASLYMHPAPVDNLPNVVLEAMACGTPSVAFDIGGVSDMVRAGQTGWLVDHYDADPMARTVDEALAEVSSGRTLRESCRAVAEDEYNLSKMSQEYVALFESMAAPGPSERSPVGSG